MLFIKLYIYLHSRSENITEGSGKKHKENIPDFTAHIYQAYVNTAQNSQLTASVCVIFVHCKASNIFKQPAQAAVLAKNIMEKTHTHTQL